MFRAWDFPLAATWSMGRWRGHRTDKTRDTNARFGPEPVGGDDIEVWPQP
jgi:hypothetical protein